MTARTPEPFLPLSRPSITELDIQSVVDVLRSGWITTGSRGQALEARFRELLGCRHAVALSSATAGMHLALHQMALAPGDEVITPSLTWVSTVNLVTLSGAKPVFVDVDRDTLMTTAELIEPRISDRTRAIVPVHIAGAALDLDPIRALCRSRGIPLLEDAAHALGTRYRGEMIGSRGTAIFSFHPIKNMTTGEGGMLCTDDDVLGQRTRTLRFHGLGVDAFDRESGGRLPQAEVLEPGFKYNLPDMNAALGLGQLGRLGDITRRRAELAGIYAEELGDVEEILPLNVPEQTTAHAWHLYVIRLDVDRARLERDEFMSALKSRGIGTGIHFRAVHSQRFYRSVLNGGGLDLPNTDWNSARLCSLPLYPGMSNEDVYRVTGAIREVLARRAA